MPSGRTHDRITLWTLPVVGTITLAVTRNSALTLLVCAGFLFGGLMFGPDLDTRSIHYRRWGWFRWIWIPYRGSMRHRSPLSHSPVTGTVLRILYLLLWVGVLSCASLTLANQIWQLGWTWNDMARVLGRSLQQYKLEGFVFCMGLEIGALSHYLADWGVTTHKRFKRQGWQALKPPRLRPEKPKSSRSRTSSRGALGKRKPK